MLHELFQMTVDCVRSGDSADTRLWQAMRVLLRQKTAMRMYETMGGNAYQRYDRWNDVDAQIGKHLSKMSAAASLTDAERLDLEFDIRTLMFDAFGRTSYRFRSALGGLQSREFLRTHVAEIETLAKAVAQDTATIRQALTNPPLEKIIQVALKPLIAVCWREQSCYGQRYNHPNGHAAVQWMYREFRAELAVRGWPLPMKDALPAQKQLPPRQDFTARAAQAVPEAGDDAFETYLAYHIKVAALDCPWEEREFMEQFIGGEPVRYTQSEDHGPVSFSVSFGCKPIEDFVSPDDLARLRAREGKLADDLGSLSWGGFYDKTWANDSPEGRAEFYGDRRRGFSC